YVRNRIRQQVLPALKQINPSVEGTWKDNAARLRDVFSVYELAMDEMKSRLLREAPGGYEIEIAALKALSPFRSCLYELLHSFGFNTSQLADIACALDGDPGKVFHSPTHRILRDRQTLIIQKLSTSRIPEPIFIDGCTREVIAPLHLVFGELPNDNIVLKSGQPTALLDRDKLEFPLLLRPWQHGDVFCPFGMTTHKKVSDFLVDAKVPLTEKERTFVLLSGDSIVWLVGLRIDNRFCITGKTKHIFRAELLRSDG
ncbi:MAG: tRNA lysidine(34) synthetase TilS, partial [Flavobacteriales bacterium]